VPWGTPCARLEGGVVVYTDVRGEDINTCQAGVPADRRVIMIGSRTYLVDVEMGFSSCFLSFWQYNRPPDSICCA